MSRRRQICYRRGVGFVGLVGLGFFFPASNSVSLLIIANQANGRSRQ